MALNLKEREVKELRRQLHELATALEEMAKAEGTDAVKTASGLAQRLTQRAGDLIDEVMLGAGKTAERGSTQLKATISDRPLLALSLAAGAGFLLAMLVRR